MGHFLSRSIFRTASFWIFSLLLGSAGAVFAESSEIIQILKDPSNPGHAWALSKKELRYSENPRGGRWETRFDAGMFSKLFRRDDSGDMELLRVMPASSEKGALYLILEANRNGTKNRQRFTLVGRNQGKIWKFYTTSRPRPPGGAAGRMPPSVAQQEAAKSEPEVAVVAPPVAKPTPAPAPVPTPAAPLKSPPPVTKVDTAGAVDLSALDDSAGASSSAATVSAAPAGGGGGGGLGIPEFKFMFDFWLYHRPNIAPLTFSNIHTLAMVDIFPVPELQFSFELSPTPRYYQVSYAMSPKLEIRVGRIWIPFDLIGPTFPHNIFGGFVNVSQFRQPGGTAFLPDIWTDLGLGLKYQLLDTDNWNWAVQAYLVNGFQDGGNDPTGQVANRYPNFESSAAIDNNSDKAIGFRSHVLWRNRIGFGVSGYTGRYTDAADTSKRIMMLGVDGQMKFNFGFELKAGYAFMNVDLDGASTPSYRRGGFYVEGTQRVGRTWRVFARGGSAQNDSRVLSVDDVSMVGGGLIYTLGYLQITLMYQHDLNVVTGKTSYDFMATRASIML